MKQRLLCLIFILATLLTGCGTMNSHFSCNATAGDSCLTIEEVDAMTRFADDARQNLPRRGMMKTENNTPKNLGKIIQQNKGESVWIAEGVEKQSWA